MRVQVSQSRVAGSIAPVLLVVVALTGIGRHIYLDQSSWSGASFGMFATIDNESTRQIRAFADGSDQRRAVDIPDALDRMAFEALVLPAEPRLARLADELANRVQMRPEAHVVVQVWGIEFDSGTGTLSRYLLSETEATP